MARKIEKWACDMCGTVHKDIRTAEECESFHGEMEVDTCLFAAFQCWPDEIDIVDKLSGDTVTYYAEGVEKKKV